METRKFKDWDIDLKIGEGRFGTVWRIRRSNPNGRADEQAALKVIRVVPSRQEIDACPAQGMTLEDLAEIYEIKLQNALREIDIMRSLQGESNIVNYQDRELHRLEGEIGWELRIRMELLTPLHSYIRTNGVSLQMIADIGKSVATALSLCHHSGKGGIVHGDVKPGNIYYSRPHCFKLGDFGLSFLAGRKDGCDGGGTRTYLAPECLNGQPLSVKSDQYALGVVLTDLLSSVKWNSSEQAESLMEIARRATMPKPEDRYGDIDDMLFALNALGVLDGKGSQVDENTTVVAHSTSTKTDLRQKESLERDRLSGMNEQKPIAQPYVQADTVSVEPSISDTWKKKKEEEDQKQKDKRHRIKRIVIIAVAVVLAMVLLVALLPENKNNIGSTSSGKSIAQMVNEYMNRPEDISIENLCAALENENNNTEYAVEFKKYANVFLLLEQGNYDEALSAAAELNYNASFSAFRAYLDDPSARNEQNLYAIRSTQELLSYVNGRRQEANGEIENAIQSYNVCLTFMDAYDRRNALE